jgi:hypothetical protein
MTGGSYIMYGEALESEWYCELSIDEMSAYRGSMPRIPLKKDVRPTITFMKTVNLYEMYAL